MELSSIEELIEKSLYRMSICKLFENLFFLYNNCFVPLQKLKHCLYLSSCIKSFALNTSNDLESEQIPQKVVKVLSRKRSWKVKQSKTCGH